MKAYPRITRLTYAEISEVVIDPPHEFNADELANRLVEKDKSSQKLITKLAAMVMAEDKTLYQKDIEGKVKAKIVKFVKANQCKPAFGNLNTTLDYDEIGGKARFNDQGERLKKTNLKITKPQKL